MVDLAVRNTVALEENHMFVGDLLHFSVFIWKLYWLTFPADHTILWVLKITVPLYVIQQLPTSQPLLSLVGNPYSSHQQFEVRTSVVSKSHPKQGVQHRHVWVCVHISRVHISCTHTSHVHISCVLSSCFGTPGCWLLSKHRMTHVMVNHLIWMCEYFWGMPFLHN